MGATPATRAEVGSEEWLKQQLKAEKDEKEAAALKAAEAAKPLPYHEMRPFQLKKLLKEAGLPDTGTKAQLISRLEQRDRLQGEQKLAGQTPPADEPHVQKISAHAGASRAKRGTGRKPPSRIRGITKIPEGTPAKVEQQSKTNAAASAGPVVETTRAADADAAATHLHVGGLDQPDAENEQKLFNAFSRFGLVLAVTLRRRRVTEASGSQKVSWALIAFAEADDAAKAVKVRPDATERASTCFC